MPAADPASAISTPPGFVPEGTTELGQDVDQPRNLAKSVTVE